MVSKAFGLGRLGDSDSTLFVDSANNRVGIGTNTPNTALDIVGDIKSSSKMIAPGFEASVASFSWNAGTATPAAVFTNESPAVLTNAHRNMRRCLLLDNGTVNYYLDPLDSTKKADGTASVLTGADGMVMVEIPKFYTKRVVSGQITTWFLSDYPLDGYAVHPAFTKNGVEVNNRYIGAYDACYWDATDSLYKSGLNLDDLTSSLDTANDKLASVSGVYPIVGATRAETRLLAAKRGTGWRQLDFWLVSAIQYLYLTEHKTFYSQLILGDGNTNVTNAYNIASSSTQANSPHSVAGKSNSLGNRSTNAVTGAVSGTRDTAYMSYRGIENFFGNCYTWVDGFNINNRQGYVSNTDTTFDDTSTTTNGYSTLGTTMPSSDNYVTNHQNIDNAWLPLTVGGASTTYWTDYFYQNTGQRVAIFGGIANLGANAGAFLWIVNDASSTSYRYVGGRLSF
jgi:hypothetical protein